MAGNVDLTYIVFLVDRRNSTSLVIMGQLMVRQKQSFHITQSLAKMSLCELRFKVLSIYFDQIIVE